MDGRHYLSPELYNIASASDDMRDRLAAFITSVATEIEAARELEARGAENGSRYVDALEDCRDLLRRAEHAIHSPGSVRHTTQTDEAAVASFQHRARAVPPSPMLSLQAYRDLQALPGGFVTGIRNAHDAYERAVELGLQEAESLGSTDSSPRSVESPSLGDFHD
jgi:hypothetical protein